MRRLAIYTTVLLGTATIALGYGLHAGNEETDHQSHTGHEMTKVPLAELPKEPGQSAFAAIAEIVSLLSADPETDWSKVNIPRLRNHLVDMELVATDARVKRDITKDGIVFSVSGAARTREAIQTMVPAHSIELNKSTSWNAKVVPTETGVTLTLSPEKEADREKILALGFFGIMATGVHHQAHHLAIAKGQMHGH